MLLLLDNRDSFTWNLAQAVAELGTEVDVRRSDAITWREAQALAPDAILIGPGPGTPERAGASLDVLRELAGSVPILGVCLGHQAIAVAYGGRVVRAARLAHGRALPVHHTGAGVFAGLPSPSWFTLYNSLVVDAAAVPDCLAVTAWSEDGEVMGLRHRSLDVEGVQFHPESILSENGLALLGNFLGRIRAGS